MRRLLFPALILLPVLAYQAQAQTSTLTASSTAPVATLEAKANTPHVLPAVPPAAKPSSGTADAGTDIMVPVHQTVVEHSGDTNTSDSTMGYTFSNGVSPVTAPKLIKALPLAVSLHDMEAFNSESSVVLQFTVNLAGTPENVKIVHSGGVVLDKRAIEAVNQYRFKPATENNIPVEAPVTVEIKIKKS